MVRGPWSWFHAIPKHYFPIRLHPFNDHRWRHLITADRSRIHHHYAPHGGKPDSASAVFTPGRLIVTAIALAVEHAVRFAERQHLHLRLPACRHCVQLPARDAINAPQAAQPQIAEVILLDVVDGIFVETVLRRESKEAALLLISAFCFLLSVFLSARRHKPVQPVLRADPKDTVGIFMDPPGTVVVLAQRRLESGDLAFVQTVESAAVGAKPKIAATILMNRAHVRGRRRLWQFTGNAVFA